jgi:hypothetical protein
MEKLVKGGQKETTSQEQLDQKFVGLEKSMDQAIKAVQTLGPAPAKVPQRSSGDKMTAIPPEMAREAADRIKEPAELGDVTQIKSIAEELKSKSDAFTPFSDRFIQLADDFEFEEISKLVRELEKMGKSG